MEILQIGSSVIGIACLIWLFKRALQLWSSLESGLAWNVITFASLLSAGYLVVELIIFVEKTPLIALDVTLKIMLIAMLASASAISLSTFLTKLVSKLKLI